MGPSQFVSHDPKMDPHKSAKNLMGSNVIALLEYSNMWSSFLFVKSGCTPLVSVSIFPGLLMSVYFHVVT